MFTSVEQSDLQSSFSYKTAMGALEPFQREKLLISVYEACKHLKRPETTALSLTDTIVSELCTQSGDPIVPRRRLVTVTTEVLTRFNKPAAVYYTAFHPVSI